MATLAPQGESSVGRKDAAAGLDYELLLDCVHCGLCTSACPTYLETGDENDSPRGRIYLMRALEDHRIELTEKVRTHLDRCLDCRACESACPSGVQYGNLIEPFRLQLAANGIRPHVNRLTNWLLFHVTPFRWRLRLALAPAKLLQWSGLDWLLDKLGFWRWLPQSLRQFHDTLPRLARYHGKLPEVIPCEGKRRARVMLFLGCAGDVFLPETTLATIGVLRRNGCEVHIPRNQVCCGALHYHGADEKTAATFARKNLDAFADAYRGSAKDFDAIIVNAAGCGAMLKEYGHYFEGSKEISGAAAFAAKVRDISEFLAELGPVPPEHPVPIKAVYHDACHLCHAQQIREQPRRLLELIPDMQVVPLEETEVCCGAAGSYTLTQPQMAERLGRRKAERIRNTGAQAVFAGNVGCILQIHRFLKASGEPMWVGHPVDALWAGYTGRLPSVAAGIGGSAT